MKCVSYTKLLSVVDVGEIPNDVIAQQNNQILKYIRNKKWKLIGKYSDKKKDILSEEAFIQLKEDAIGKKFDCLVVDSILRCGANPISSIGVIKDFFIPAGIQFAVVEDNFCSADFGTEAVMAYLENKIKEYKSAVARVITLGINEKKIYEKYGYFHKDRKMELIIDPVAAKGVKRIFDLLLEGKSCTKVAEIMEQEGYESQSQYLRKLRGQSVPEQGISWNCNQVTRLAKNRIYIGEWERTIGGKKQIFECPVIVDREHFEKVQQILEARSSQKTRKKLFPNAYIKRIYDLETGIPIKIYDHQRLKIKIFRFSYPKTTDVSYEKGFMTYEDADNLVREEVVRECQRAEKITAYLQTEEAQKVKEEQINMIRAKAEQIFHKMLKVENRQMELYEQFQEGVLTETDYYMSREHTLELFKEYDSVFAGMMEEIYFIEKAFSNNNEWLSAFTECVLPEKIDFNFVKKYIEAVYCVRFEDVRVSFLYEEWKEYFPNEWMEV